jgi:hypothetical protein
MITILEPNEHSKLYCWVNEQPDITHIGKAETKEEAIIAANNVIQKQLFKCR